MDLFLETLVERSHLPVRRTPRSASSILMIVSNTDLREVSSARISCDDTVFQCTGRNQPICKSRAVPSASRRSVLIGLAFRAPFTCRVSISTASKPASVSPLYNHWDILDDWGLAPIDAARGRDLLEILDDRFGDRSVIVTSQLPAADWHRQLNDPTLADVILDRLVHGAIRFELHGTSMRTDEAGAGTKI